MKTAELIGAKLDYWVGKGEDWHCNHWSTGELMTQAEWIESHEHGSKPKPSSNWSSGGLIIEREKMSVAHVDDGHGVGWVAYMPAIHHGFGATPLIAAMRAYVASKYGDEVPDALQSGVSPASKTAT